MALQIEQKSQTIGAFTTDGLLVWGRRKSPAGVHTPQRLSAITNYHPALPAVFFSVALLVTMLFVHPVLSLISFCCAFAVSVALRGWHAAARSLIWQLPLVLLVAVVNPFFSAAGSTELFRLGLRAIYAESLIYGAVMGMVLAAVTTWFSNAAEVLSTDKVMTLCGSRFPTIALMISMILRLVPRFVHRGRSIAEAHDVCTASKKGSRTFAANVRQISVLMEWSMEDSLETADAMRARSWGSGARRTCYTRLRFTKDDAVHMLLLCLLAAVAFVMAVIATSNFQFYPRLSLLGFWWGYPLYALFLLFPFIMQCEEVFRCRRTNH